MTIQSITEKRITIGDQEVMNEKSFKFDPSTKTEHFVVDRIIQNFVS